MGDLWVEHRQSRLHGLFPIANGGRGWGESAMRQIEGPGGSTCRGTAGPAAPTTWTISRLPRPLIAPSAAANPTNWMPRSIVCGQMPLAAGGSIAHPSDSISAPAPAARRHACRPPTHASRLPSRTSSLQCLGQGTKAGAEEESGLGSGNGRVRVSERGQRAGETRSWQGARWKEAMRGEYERMQRRCIRAASETKRGLLTEEGAAAMASEQREVGLRGPARLPS